MPRINRMFYTFFSILLCIVLSGQARANELRPFILGDTPSGSMTEVIETVKTALEEQDFNIVGVYSPYPEATVICITHGILLTAAEKAMNGGFGAAQRVAVTEVNGKLQISYANPAYLGTAYGLGKLEDVSEKLSKALGNRFAFGAKGVKEKKLGPGKYRYKMFMPTFKDVDVLNTYTDYRTGVETVEKNLAQGEGGTSKVYRIDLPNSEVSIFGVAIPQGDGPDSGAKDTDREVMEVIDFQEHRATAYLPYELMVKGNEAIALRGRYRIAVHFPDTKMVGEHGFTSIMSSPGGIKAALKAVAGK